MAIILAGFLFALPNGQPAPVPERWPGVMPNKPVALGLDLRGGSHLVLEVDGAELSSERVRNLADDAPRVLRDADVRWRSVQAGELGVSITLQPTKQQARALDLLAALSSPVGVARKDMDLTRSGPGGVSEPTIQRVGADRILMHAAAVLVRLWPGAWLRHHDGGRYRHCRVLIDFRGGPHPAAAGRLAQPARQVDVCGRGA